MSTVLGLAWEICRGGAAMCCTIVLCTLDNIRGVTAGWCSALNLSSEYGLKGEVDTFLELEYSKTIAKNCKLSGQRVIPDIYRPETLIWKSISTQTSI